MRRNTIEIESELRIVANWDFNYLPGGFSLLPITTSRERLVNFLCQRLNCMIRTACIVDYSKRIKEDRYCRVARCEFDNAGNICVLEPPKCAEDFAESFLRRVFKSVANAHNQRGISKRRNFHWCTNPGQEQKMRSARSHRFDVDLNRDILADT